MMNYDSLLCGDLENPEVSKKIINYLAGNEDVEIKIKGCPRVITGPLINITATKYHDTFSSQRPIRSNTIIGLPDINPMPLEYYILKTIARIDAHLDKNVNKNSLYAAYNLARPSSFYSEELLSYCKADVEVTKSVLNSYRKNEIKKVIFNNPATIVIWGDGSKTVVKVSEGEIYDPEKGLAMCISKRFLGDKGNYYETFKKHLPKDTDSSDPIDNGLN